MINCLMVDNALPGKENRNDPDMGFHLDGISAVAGKMEYIIMMIGRFSNLFFTLPSFSTNNKGF